MHSRLLSWSQPKTFGVGFLPFGWWPTLVVDPSNRRYSRWAKRPLLYVPAYGKFPLLKVDGLSFHSRTFTLWALTPHLIIIDTSPLHNLYITFQGWHSTLSWLTLHLFRVDTIPSPYNAFLGEGKRNRLFRWTDRPGQKKPARQTDKAVPIVKGNRSTR